jgi:predicted O-methyltransferase YrrM
MEKININRFKLSDLIWQSIFESNYTYSDITRTELLNKSNLLDNLRKYADYNTGSISAGAIWALFSATMFFKPKIIAEVGTFIGKSTFAMACGMDIVHGQDCQIYTCDFSNNIKLNFDTNTIIKQFPKKPSTVMFQQMVTEFTKCDMLLIDGRLQREDLNLLPSVIHDETVILLDDFEGTEKGVINSIHLMDIFKDSHLLAYPPKNSILHSINMNSSCTIAVIIPNTLINYTNQ